MRVILILLLTGFVSAAGAQKMYRWVDENGTTHYSKTPPPASVDSAEKIKVRPSRPASAPETSESNSAAEPEKEQDKQVAQANNRPRKARAHPDDCKQARDSIPVMQNVDRVLVKQADGTEVWMSGEDRIAQIEKAKQYLADYCD